MSVNEFIDIRFKFQLHRRRHCFDFFKLNSEQVIDITKNIDTAYRLGGLSDVKSYVETVGGIYRSFKYDESI